MTINELKQEFMSLYGEGGNIRFFASPGRVNLIGEHIDYNGGFVFPAALTMKTTIVARKRNDNKIVLRATDLPDVVEADINNLDNKIIREMFNDMEKSIRTLNYGVLDKIHMLEIKIKAINIT